MLPKTFLSKLINDFNCIKLPKFGQIFALSKPSIAQYVDENSRNLATLMAILNFTPGPWTKFIPGDKISPRGEVKNGPLLCGNIASDHSLNIL
jgi:hypothetical protein